MSRQNKARREKIIELQVRSQHKTGTKVGTPGPKHNKKKRLKGATNYRGTYLRDPASLNKKEVKKETSEED
jgi:hypothetical protein